MRKKLMLTMFAGAVAFAGVHSVAQDAPKADLPPAATKQVDYVADVKPILKDRCWSCHGADKQKGKLRLDGKAEALKGGDSGVAIKAGDSANSLLIQVVVGSHPDIDIMPPKGDPLTAEQVGILRAWIDQGVQWPDAEATAPAPTTPAPAK